MFCGENEGAGAASPAPKANLDLGLVPKRLPAKVGRASCSHSGKFYRDRSPFTPLIVQCEFSTSPTIFSLATSWPRPMTGRIKVVFDFLFLNSKPSLPLLNNNYLSPYSSLLLLLLSLPLRRPSRKDPFFLCVSHIAPSSRPASSRACRPFLGSLPPTLSLSWTTTHNKGSRPTCPRSLIVGSTL